MDPGPVRRARMRTRIQCQPTLGVVRMESDGSYGDRLVPIASPLELHKTPRPPLTLVLDHRCHIMSLVSLHEKIR